MLTVGKTDGDCHFRDDIVDTSAPLKTTEDFHSSHQSLTGVSRSADAQKLQYGVVGQQRGAVGQELHKDEEFILYRGQHPDRPDTRCVLLRVPTSPHAGPETVKKLRREHSLMDVLDPEWAVRPLGLSEQPGQIALVLEDPGGETLDRLVREKVGISQCLRLATGLAKALGSFHRTGLVHKDVKPANVLVDPAGRIRLMGFGIASALPRERQVAEPPQLIAGSLPYMAPEQTGRMNRSIDSRSDLYALGVTLYELMTGSLPFTASDPMEWVHSHMARQPVPPSERSNEIPRALSAIILKLLAKHAEERYQTAAGVEWDLRRCFSEWESSGRIDEFPLGQHDTPDRLLIPEKLYGRESELAALRTALDRMVRSGKPELTLVSGYSGIGKSSVVNELHKSFLPKRVSFASGKIDQHGRDIPYAPLAQVFRSLLLPILTACEADLEKWRESLLKALRPNGQIIADMVPELNLIIGGQPPVPALPAKDAHTRFQLVIRRFIDVFAQPEHPLVLFLDNLQWLDTATLDLLEDLLTHAEVRHLLVIGAYRDNEVVSSHPLVHKLEMIRHSGGRIQEVVLGPLPVEDLGLLLADCVHCERERAASLTHLIHEKTAGNPFFFIQFLSTLADAGLLALDHGEGRWTWNLDRIRAEGYTDNVADLVIAKVSRLSSEAQTELRLLASIGNKAEFTVLEMIYQESIEEIHSRLGEAVRAGLISRTEHSYRFLHDRVQEAAYSLIPEGTRAETHLRIGRRLAAQTSSAKREERVFDIVNQLNRGSSLITSGEERVEVAELNLIAAKRAKNSIAYEAAIRFLTAGRAMLTGESWGQSSELIFSIESLTAECELLTANMEAAEKRLSALVERAATAHDLAVVTRLQLTLYTALDRLDRAVEVCLSYLRRTGMNWSHHPTGEEVQREYDRIWILLGDKQIEDILDLALLDNPEILNLLEILAEFLTTAVFFDNALCALVICRMVNLSLEYGVCDASCLAYVWFGMIVGPRFGNYGDAFRFGQLGYDLLEKRGFTRYEARTCMCFGGIVLPWKKHLRQGRDLVRHAFDVAYRAGDFTYAVYSFTQLVTNFLVAGDPLEEAQTQAERGIESAAGARLGLVVDLLMPSRQLIRTLRGLTNTFGSFNDNEFDEAGFERRLASNPALAAAAFVYWAHKAEARFFASEYTSAVEASSTAQKLLWVAAPLLLEVGALRFYSALSHAASCDSAAPIEKAAHMEAMRAHQRQLELYAEHSPPNFKGRAALVGAEIARTEIRIVDAEQLYEQAIRSARASDFAHDEALANELAGRFYSTRSFNKIADMYLRDARCAYQRWGANGKVGQLDRLYPHLKEPDPAFRPTGTIMAPGELLDLHTAIKVSEAISGEMVLEKLNDKIIRVAVENAGAERGLLIALEDGHPQIKAEATMPRDDFDVSGELDASGMPESLVRYVTRTREPVILGDASSPGRFSADPYIVRHRVRSALCLPLMNQAQMGGVLYLENNLAPDVFTAGRITVLKVLASQAAISLENARLYCVLKDREARIRRLVDANILGICFWTVKGAILEANDAFLEMVGYSREDFIAGRLRWTELAEWHEHDQQIVAATKSSEAFQPQAKELLRKDGSRLPVLLGATMLEESDDEGVTFVLDLTEQKRAETEISALKDRLYQENVALRDAYREVSELKEKLAQEKLYLEQEIRAGFDFGQIVGNSPALNNVLRLVETVAPSDSTVLLIGETGTGKELIARAIHDHSLRKDRTLVKINCAAIPAGLLESELFGHEKGAFTGAISQKIGRLELADQGTLFLDEVGDIPLELQPKLLRALQEREFERLGSTRTRKVNIRLIAATNRDLERMVAAREFRSDLYYRLNVFPIRIPPLRERKDDIPQLVSYFVEKSAKQMQKRIDAIPAHVMKALKAWEWPGNIRELENLIERAVILTRGRSLEAPLAELRKVSLDSDLHRSRDQERVARIVQETIKALRATAGEEHQDLKKERDSIVRALTESKGRVGGADGAAAHMGLKRTTLLARMKKLAIDARDYL